MIIVKEGLKGKNPSEKVTYGGTISTKMTGNAFYTDAVFTTAIAALDTATGNLKTANKSGSTTNIEVMTTAFDNSVKSIVLAIQNLILGIPDDLAKEMVESAGFGWKKKGKPIIADLAAKQGTEAKTVNLRKKVTTGRKHVSYIWQMSLSLGETAHWDFCKFSTIASVTVSGLTSGVRYYFRVAIVIGEEMSEYSDPTDIVVN